MSWYSGAPVQRPIDKLIDSGITSIEQLYNDPDFFSQLKAFNPKLLDFLTNNPFVVQQSLVFISNPPKDTDSDQRKYKYPMMTVQMIETETISIINSFFKPSSQGKFVIEQLFKLLQQKQILPILGGYFVRIICVLIKQKYKEILDFIYSKPDILKAMIQHTYNISVTQSLQMFLCLESTKCQRIIQGKQQIKVEILSLILNQFKNSKNEEVVTNICYLLISLIDSYYLISDGKKLLETVLSQQLFQYLFSSLLKGKQLQIINNSLLSILRYYTYSSFNIQQRQSSQLNQQIMQRLQAQPVIKVLTKYYKQLGQRALQSRSILQKYGIIEILCQTIQLNSNKIFQLVKQTHLFKKLLDIMFLNSSANIVHQQINKVIEIIFSNQRFIYEKYQEHLFCEVDIITLTLSRIQNQTLKSASQKDYFGHLIKIIKNYSKIQTSNNKIYQIIQKHKDLWTKVANGIIKSYTEATQKELGTYQIPDPQPIQYKETKLVVPTVHPSVMVNLNIDDEGKTFRNMTSSYPQSSGRLSFEGNLFQIPLEVPQITEQKPISQSIQELGQASTQITKSQQQLTNKKIPLVIEIPQAEPIAIQPTKSPSWQQYKKNASKLAEEKIELQKRSISQDKQRRLTPNSRANSRGKSPGVAKVKRSWGDSNQQKPSTQIKNKIEDKTAIAESKIPAAPKKQISQSMIFPAKQTQKHNQITMSQSMVNLNDLKNIKVKFVPTNKKNEPKKSRKVQAKDMLLLNFLGIKVNNK